MYEGVRREFNSNPRWGIWLDPFDYLSFRDPAHEYRVRQARHHLARWGDLEAGKRAAGDLERPGLGRMHDALEDLIALGPIGSEWVPNVRAFHRRHRGQRWGLDVLALTSMGAPEGLTLLEEGLRNRMNPGAYLPQVSSKSLDRALTDPQILQALRQLQQADPRYRVRSFADMLLGRNHDRPATPPPMCFSEYSYTSDRVRVGWADQVLTLKTFPARETTSGPCDHAPRKKKDWSNHVALLGECGVFYGERVQPGHAVIYPREGTPYTLLENEYPRSVLNWNDSAWIVSIHTHAGWGAGGLLRVDKDQAGYLRIAEHIDLGGAPLAYLIEHDGSLVVLANRISVFGTPHCTEDETESLDLLRIRPDLAIEPVQ